MAPLFFKVSNKGTQYVDYSKEHKKSDEKEDSILKTGELLQVS